MTTLSATVLDRLLAMMAEGTAVPAAGSAAGWSVAIAAGLTAKAARLSRRQMADADELATAADELRRYALQLADDDAVAVAAMIETSQSDRSNSDSATPDSGSSGNRSDQESSSDYKSTVESDALQVPRRIQVAAGQVFELAERIAAEGNPWLYGDAVTARLLAQAANESAATLIQANID